jgi:hypothetical protein
VLLSLFCIGAVTGCVARPPVAFPEPATVADPGSVRVRLSPFAAYAPEGRFNTAASASEAGSVALSTLINAQSAVRIGVVRPCEVSPAVAFPLLQAVDLNLKCALLNASHDGPSVALGIGGRTNSFAGPFTSYQGRVGLYTSYRMDTVVGMLSVHLSYGEQVYFDYRGRDDFGFEKYALYAGRETRLSVPFGIAPVVDRGGFRVSLGVVPSFVLDAGSARHLGSSNRDEPIPERRVFNAPWEVVVTLQFEWGRGPLDRPSPRLPGAESVRRPDPQPARPAGHCATPTRCAGGALIEALETLETLETL